MNPSRVAVIVVGVNLVAVWAAAAAGGRMAPQAGAAAGPPIAADLGVGDARASLAAAVVRLDRHSRPAPPLARGRDPFRFGGASGADARNSERRPAEIPADTSTEPEAPRVQEPDIVLQGMAESQDGDTLVRTAILRAGGDLVLATLGTRFGGRFEVAGIGADSVELEDVIDHSRRTFRLK